jgi:hypothetical protein
MPGMDTGKEISPTRIAEGKNPKRKWFDAKKSRGVDNMPGDRYPEMPKGGNYERASQGKGKDAQGNDTVNGIVIEKPKKKWFDPKGK